MSSLETGDRGGGESFSSRENTPVGHTDPHTSSFTLYKQVSLRNGDHE